MFVFLSYPFVYMYLVYVYLYVFIYLWRQGRWKLKVKHIVKHNSIPPPPTFQILGNPIFLFFSIFYLIFLLSQSFNKKAEFYNMLISTLYFFFKCFFHEIPRVNKTQNLVWKLCLHDFTVSVDNWVISNDIITTRSDKRCSQ